MQRNALKYLPADIRRVIRAAIIDNDGFIDIFAVLLQNLPQKPRALILDDHRKRQLGPPDSC